MKGGSSSAAAGVVGAGYSILDWGGGVGAVAAAPGSNLLRGGAGVAILNGAPARNRPELYFTVPYAGTLSLLYVEINAAYGAGIGVNYTVYVNEVAQAITCNISGAAQTAATDLANSVVLVAGDRVYLHCDRSAGVPGVVTHAAWLRLAAA